MKTTIEFKLPEEREELANALRATEYKTAIDSLYNEVFRPHLKRDEPIFGGELLDYEREIIEALWKKVAKHFENVLE